MIKAFMHLNLQDYRQAAKEAWQQFIHWNYIGGAHRRERVEPPRAAEELLPPPNIITVALDDYRGRENDFIGILAFPDFGIHAMHITILDDWGGRIEGGDAIPSPDARENWAFFPAVRVPAGMSVVVQVTAMDYMGGVGRYWVGKTIGEDGQ